MEASKKRFFLEGKRSTLSILIDRSFMLINMYELKPFIVMPTVVMLSALGFVFYDIILKCMLGCFVCLFGVKTQTKLTDFPYNCVLVFFITGFIRSYGM